MKNKRNVALFVAASVVVIGFGSALNSSGDEVPIKREAPSVVTSKPTVTLSPTKAAPADDKEVKEDSFVVLPDFTGVNHQAAQDKIQELGFNPVVLEEDASGQGRMLAWDRNWTVCSQDPDPGVRSKGATVTLHSVKKGEVCP